MSAHMRTSQLLWALPFAMACATPSTATPLRIWTAVVDGDAAAASPVAIKIGCGDWLVPKSIEVTASDKTGRLSEEMTKLFREMQSDVAVGSVTETKSGALVLDLKGELAFGGACDSPRFIGAVEKTAGQFGAVNISLNGDAKAWRCAADESGHCK